MAATNKLDESISDFYLIRAVTFLEVFTRQQIAMLIDHANEYTDRAVELSKHFKMDFALVRDVQGRAITLGDIVAHSVPVNSFSQVFSYFETLLGKKLRPLMEVAVDRWSAEIEEKPPEPIIRDFDVLANRLSGLFEIRHILCHEMPSKPVYQVSEVADFLEEATRFAKALEEILTFEKFGIVPLTQTGMNVAAHDRLVNREAELSRLLSVIRKGVQKADERNPHTSTEDADKSWLLCLDESQEKWLAYRNAHCDFVTYLSQRGTIWPLLWSSAADEITKIRIADLESWLERESERLVIFSSDEEISE